MGSLGGQRRYVVGTVSGAHFVSHVYLLAYPPLFPLLAAEFDLTTTRLGLLVTAIYVPTLLFQLPVGDLVDRIGAKRILVGGIAVTSLGIALSGLSGAYWLLLACAFVSGIGQSAFHPADYALLDAVTERDTEGVAFSLHTFGGFAGFAAAPVAVGGLGLSVGWDVALVAVGSLGFAYAAFVHLTMDPVHGRTLRDRNRSDSHSAGRSVREMVSFVRRGDLLSVFVFYALSMMAIVGLQSFTTLLAVETYGLDGSTANTLLTAHLVSMAVGILVGGPVADRLPPGTVILLAFLPAAFCVWVAVVGPVGGLSGPLVALSLAGLLIGVALPSRDRFANAVADPGATGTSFGFFFTGLSLGAVLAPVLLGAVIDARSAAAAFAVVGVFLLLAVAVVVLTTGGPEE
ncbi:MFS transporter [Natronorarus salvus]|uniref:MFS transporter n=1 Tax=Natronorarus salvus TaxID=3117733 RepID=UPI002F2684D7